MKVYLDCLYLCRQLPATEQLLRIVRSGRGGAGRRSSVAIQQQLWRENTQPSSSGGRGREVRVYTRRAPGDHTSLGHHTSLHTLARGVPPSIVGRPIVFICPRTSKEKPVPPFFLEKWAIGIQNLYFLRQPIYISIENFATVQLFKHKERPWWLAHHTHWPPRLAMTGGFTVNWLIVAEK